MEVTGLLAAAVAVAVFPGGIYLAAAAVAVSRGAAVRHWHTLTPPEIAGLVSLTLAAALIPLPGSPGQLIPTNAGAESNLLALLVLAAVALGLGTVGRWGAWRTAAALAATLPLLALAVQGSTFSATAVAGLAGGRLGLARSLAALSLLLASPALAGAGDQGGGEESDSAGHRFPGAAQVALGALLAVGIGLPEGWSGVPGVVVAGVALGVAALVGLGLHSGLQPWARRAGAAAVLPAVASVALALLRG